MPEKSRRWREVYARVTTWMQRQKEGESAEMRIAREGVASCRRCGAPACSCSEAEIDAGGPGE